eukprot:4426284-Amphidinium_carterae.1
MLCCGWLFQKWPASAVEMPNSRCGGQRETKSWDLKHHNKTSVLVGQIRGLVTCALSLATLVAMQAMWAMTDEVDVEQQGPNQPTLVCQLCERTADAVLKDLGQKQHKSSTASLAYVW